MDAEEHKAAIRRVAEAFGAGDIDAVFAEATDDFEFTLAGSPPGGGTARGKQAMVDAIKALFGSKLEGGAIAMTVENLIAEGDFVVEQARGRARTVDGNDYNNVYCRVWRFRDGKIAALTEYMDTELARRRLWT